MNELVHEWLKQAEKDLKTIEKIIEEKELTNIVAFHSQQCIEKVFKAVILENNEIIPKIHNLLKLYGMIKAKIKFKINIKRLERINETYIDTRYPSDLGLLPEGQPTLDTAKEFYDDATEILKNIKNELEKENNN